LIGRVLDRVYRQEGSSGCKGGCAPPPPGIATVVPSSIPAAVSPPVIIEITVEIVLDTVVYLGGTVVPEIIYVIRVVVPLVAIKPVPYVSVVPKIADIVPIFGAVVTEIGDLALVLTRPLIPILLAIRDGLPALR
jgi:hypothetical protein